MGLEGKIQAIQKKAPKHTSEEFVNRNQKQMQVIDLNKNSSITIHLTIQKIA
jgi:hypothetical protein